VPEIFHVFDVNSIGCASADSHARLLFLIDSTIDVSVGYTHWAFSSRPSGHVKKE